VGGVRHWALLSLGCGFYPAHNVGDGCRYNEMRSAYEVAEQSGWEVYIGSHAVAKPTAFVDAVGQLDKATSGKGPIVSRGV
jgi:hypothetical protein